MSLAAIDNADASLAELEAELATFEHRLPLLREQRAREVAKSAAAARSTNPQAAADALGAKIMGIDLLIGGNETVIADLRARIDTARAAADAAVLAQRWAAVSALLDERDQAIDEAEAHAMAAAQCLKTALDRASQAIALAPDPPSVHQSATIREGLNLIPALTQRMWLECSFSHPQIQALDNLHARRLGKLSAVFAFEREQILSTGAKHE